MFWHDSVMSQMSMGANLEVPSATVRATLRWTAGPGIPEVDASALLLAENGEVGSDADFVFYNQAQHGSGAVRMSGKTPPPTASDSIDIDLDRVPAGYRRIVLAASTDGGSFGQVPELQLELLDIASGALVASFPMRADTETAFVCAELYRRESGWKFRAIGQGYASGLDGLATDFGISVGGSPTAAPPAAPPPPTAPPAAAPAAAAPPPAPVAPAAAAAAPAASGNLLDLDNPV